MNGVKTIFQAVPTFIPKLVPVGLLLLGLILGFFWAYSVAPNVYTAAEPVNLGPTWKQEYVKQVAWQLSASGDTQNAQKQLNWLGDADKVLQETIVANQADPNLIPKLAALQPLALPNPVQTAKITPSFTNSNLTPILCVLGLAILAGGLVILNTLVPIGLIFAPKSKEASTIAVGAEKERRDAIKAADKQKTDFTKVAPERGKPVSQFMSTYLLNDDSYDDSFSIETPEGDFLGETGAGISKTVGEGMPKKVTAVEAWVFDKNDIKTVTKVLLSDYAYQSDAIRNELAVKGEGVALKPGLITMLETTTLTVQVRVVDMEYQPSSLGDNSVLSRLTLEIAAWPKKAPVGGIPDPYGMNVPPASNPPPAAPRFNVPPPPPGSSPS